MKTRPLLQLLIVLSAAFGLAVWFFESPAPRTEHPRSAAVAAGAEESVKAPLREPHGGAPPERGAARSYALELANHFAPEGSADEDAAFSLALSATLDIAPFEGSPQSQRLRLRDLEIRDGATRDTADPATVAGLRRSLEQPFTLHFDASGRLQELELGFASDAFAEGLVRLIGSALQFVPPEDAEASEWTARELDGAGEADVHYRKLGARAFLKTKRSYLRVVTDAGLQDPKSAGTSVSVTSSTHVEHDAAGAMQSLRLAETLTHRIEDMAFENSATLSLRFTGSAAERTAKARATVLTAGRRARLEQLPARAAVAPGQAQRELVGEASFADLKQELAAVQADDTEGRRRARERLEAALELGQGDARELATFVAGENPTAASIALGALADTDTPAAQAALRELARAEDVAPERRDDALAMLGLASAPAPETAELAREVSEDAEHPSQATATLALGNLARTLDASGSEQGSALVAELIARLKQAETESERMLLLGALGNTGAAPLPALLAPWLADSSPGVRAAATFALRLCRADAAFTVLSQKAVTDPAALVRLKAVSALGYSFSERALGVLDQVLRKDADPDVRLEALSALASNGSAEVLPLVEWVAQNDADPNVKRQAESLLEVGG